MNYTLWFYVDCTLQNYFQVNFRLNPLLPPKNSTKSDTHTDHIMQPLKTIPET